MRRRLAIVALVAAIAVATGAAQRPSAPDFRYQRRVHLATPGSHRLDVDVPLLAGATPFAKVTPLGDRWVAQGGLDDLRLYDESSREIPYLLVPPPAAVLRWREARVLPIAATKKTSGFEADLGEVISVDALQLAGIPAPFLKRFALEASGDRERWSVVIAESTAFDLPDERLERRTFAFAAGPYRYLRVTWDDTSSGRVAAPRSVTARQTETAIAPPAVLRTPLPAERRPSEPGRSRFRIDLPAAHLPIVALELAVGGGHLLRDARVTEARLSGGEASPETIGAAVLRRVVRDGVSADALRIHIQPPREGRVDLVVEDGDNPPLELTGVTAIFAELPWIYFEHPAGTIYARFGTTRLDAPRYDLEAARREIMTVDATPARWGDVTVTAPSAGLATAGLPMPDTGSALDPAEFRYSRDIASGAAGLIAVPLDAAVLAHSRGPHERFADVRVVDTRGQQVPYLLERRDEPTTVDVGVELRALPDAIRRRERWSSASAYVVRLPYRRLPAARLAVYTRARVFTRVVTLAALEAPTPQRREDRLEVLGNHTWTHADRETAAPALIVDVPADRRGEFVVLVDEGDNQRLPIERATLLMPSYAVRLFRRADQPLRLVYGRDDLGAPRYDLALLAPQVMGQVASDAPPAAEQVSQAAAPARIVSPPVFWVSLGLAVLVLLGLIVRLVRRDGEAALHP
jgi:hypothetical protein